MDASGKATRVVKFAADITGRRTAMDAMGHLEAIKHG